MPTNAENLATALANLTAKYAEVTANPQPSYNIHGQAVSWDEYRKSLLEEIKTLQETISASDAPWEIES